MVSNVKKALEGDLDPSELTDDEREIYYDTQIKREEVVKYLNENPNTTGAVAFFRNEDGTLSVSKDPETIKRLNKQFDKIDNDNNEILVGGAGTTDEGIVSNFGKTISETYDSAANTISNWFGNEPDDTVVDEVTTDDDEPGGLEGPGFTDQDILNAPGFGNDPDDTVVDEVASDENTDPDPGLDPNFSPVSAIANTGVNEPEVEPEDWRVRLHLPPDAEYLYNHPTYRGILEPLKETDGVIFPYTPNITVQHQAAYSNYDLTHSNYRGYFYTGSSVQSLTINTTFTAQDTEEANYMLAALHFFRSCTKMFYGQDVQRGMPPPVIMLTGFGEYQYKNHPCAITLMAYNLPDDTDYIAAGVPDGQNPYDGFKKRLPTGGGYQSPTSRFSRMFGAGIGGLFGGGSGSPQFTQPPPQTTTGSLNDFSKLEEIYKGKTYVPTKVMVNLQLIPIQTRNQVSKEFSLREYANGELLKEGFW